jgi:hypothetical protein
MDQKLVKILERLGLLDFARKLHLPNRLKHWKKQKTILFYKKRFSPDIMVETGTYRGDMVSAMKGNFRKIYSIELSDELYKKAADKFGRDKHIKLFLGDSAKVLPDILSEIKEPSLFWLDAHYSAGITAKGEKNTPVFQELETILNHPVRNHVILIDDAVSFVGEHDYPRIEALDELIKKKNPNYALEVSGGIIRIYPKNK